MLISFDGKSNRVHGLSFHSKRPWILASMHDGAIEIWDYRIGTMIKRFDEHEGPVRSVHFHDSRTLFVSGGDDSKIKIWNYDTHKSAFTLVEDRGCIRTVQFHHKLPWIVSASDDRTIRIHNWQSRACVSLLTGHTDRVMSASFHPEDDLIVSASLDKTVRVWDIGALVKQTGDEVKQVLLTGHEKGVNWASFHPTEPLIVSAANDHLKLWWYTNGTQHCEANTLQGYAGNVSSVFFYTKGPDIIVVSASRRSIDVWDHTNQVERQTFPGEHGRIWTLAVHPKMKLFAAGHDSGMIVFKLEREHPAFALSGNYLFHAKERSLWRYDFSTQRDAQLGTILVQHPSRLNQIIRSISYSSTKEAIVISSDMNGGSYEVFKTRTGGRFCKDKGRPPVSAIFFTHDHYAILEKGTNQVRAKKVDGFSDGKLISLPIIPDAIFFGGTGNLLCRSQDKLVVFYLTKNEILGELQTPSVVRYVVWSADMERVALLSKHAIIIASKTLVLEYKLHETKRVKSGAWDDENGVFIYTTLDHIKYCLPNGDSGIIKTLDAPMYVTKVSGNTVFCLGRDGENKGFTIDATEYIVKLALLSNKKDHAKSLIDSSRLCGQALAAYLQQKGFPELALSYLEQQGLPEDERIPFNLAIESGNLTAAAESARKIDEKDHWHKLGVEAVRQGEDEIAESAYDNEGNFERLSFFYLITGDLKKLSDMTKTAEVKNVMGQFQNALYRGDVEERVKILENAGQMPLAYVTASVHGLCDVAERLASELGDNVPSLPEGKTAMLPVPPKPVASD